MKKRHIILYILISFLLIATFILNICIGSKGIGLRETLEVILTHDTASVNGTVIWDIRLPRVVAALLLGGALSLSGYALQSFFANPIAGPFVLGISSGAKLMVALLMVAATLNGFMLNSVMLIAAAFVGSLIVTRIVIALSGRVKSMSVLIVCGVMVGYICSAVTELAISFADDTNIVNLHSWTMGSFSSISWSNVLVMTPVVIAGSVMIFFMSKGIEAYLYGEQYAMSVGMDVKLFRKLLIVVSSLFSATVTAFVGPVSFVGIAVPHMARVLFKTSKPKVLISASFLMGAWFCMFCDLMARRLFAPSELSISTITAVFGAPVVISMLLKKEKRQV